MAYDIPASLVMGTVQCTLRENVKVWGHSITKLECSNHAMKCFRSHFENLVKDKPQYKGRNQRAESRLNG